MFVANRLKVKSKQSPEKSRVDSRVCFLENHQILMTKSGLSSVKDDHKSDGLLRVGPVAPIVEIRINHPHHMNKYEGARRFTCLSALNVYNAVARWAI